MERREQEAARLVSREEAAGAISAMRRRGEADQENPRLPITERRQGPAPVDLSPKTAGRVRRRLFAPGHEPRTAPAGDDLARDPGERVAETRAQSVARLRL